MKGVRLWMLGNVLKEPWVVQQGQQNRAAVRQTPFAIMQIISRTRYTTNSRINHDDGSITLIKPERMVIQITTFGKDAGNVVSTLNTLWRDEFAVQWFRKNLPQFGPLYASNPLQHAFMTTEHQYEDQWSVDLHADLKSSLTIPGQSALHLGMKQLTQADRLETKKE